MEVYEDFHDSMKPKNQQSNSQRDTTAKKKQQRTFSERKSQKSKVKTRSVSVVSEVEDLFTKQQKASKKGKYDIAFNYKKKIEQLKNDLLKQRVKEIKQDQKIDRKQIQQAHEIEMARIQEAWNKLAFNSDIKIQEMITKWELKKQQQISQLQEELQRANKKQSKAKSKKLIQLQESKKYFVKIQDYNQAKIIQKQIKQLSLSLFEKEDNDFQNKSKKMRLALKQQHQKQQVVLNDRIMKAKQEHNIHCSQLKKKLNRKFQNMIKRIQRQQFLQVQSFEMSGNLPANNPLKLSRRNAQWIFDNFKQQ